METSLERLTVKHMKDICRLYNVECNTLSFANYPSGTTSIYLHEVRGSETSMQALENNAFVNGDGIDKPRGFLRCETIENKSWIGGRLGYVDAGNFSANEIIDLVYSLSATYRANATFVMNSKTAGAVRKMKDAGGRFLWSDGLSAGEPARLMGYGVLICEDMPDIVVNAFAIAFGDFASGYTIAERIVDPITKRIGGGVVNFEAIKLMKF